jgi:hypothetical protein
MSHLEKTSAAHEPPLAAANPPRPFQFRLWHVLVAMGVISVALAVLVPLYRQQLRQQSENNLKQIALGLWNYHDTWNCLPPAYSCDVNGKPMHSWRVLITPYIEQQPVFDRYNYAEPWNGPNNSKLGAEMPSVFRNPLERAGSTQYTSYVAVIGPDTMWPGSQNIDMAAVTDGTATTIMVVEISHSNVHWMEPRDLPFEELQAWRDPNHRPHLGGDIEGGYVVYADGGCKYLPRDVATDQLRKQLLINDRGEWWW